MHMRKLTKIQPLRRYVKNWRQKGQTVALVPTMGNLHDGHCRLVEKAKQLADQVTVSIFVNPTQFGADEDFDIYPRTIKEDTKLLEHAGADLLFHPEANEMYQMGASTNINTLETQIIVPRLNDIFCGKTRLNHFNGVAIIVTKLFNIVQPDVAVFGTKDYQQLLLIKKLVADLCLPIKIVSVETLRENTGLALSSRNRYLDKQQWALATELYKTLLSISKAIQNKHMDYRILEANGIAHLKKQGFKVEYLSIRNASDLQEPTEKNLIVLAAAWLGKTRLIDNIQIKHT